MDNKNMTDIAPTVNQTTAYQAAFDLMNEELFDGKLPKCILNFSRKGTRVLGFFAPNRWADSAGLETHEISLNPDHLSGRSSQDTLSTLLHEMCHLWRNLNGQPPKRGYHDKAWGQKMEEVGLIPSNSGLPGGKKTGVQMTHYVQEGGKFELLAKRIPPLPFLGLPLDRAKAKARNKVKYTCECGDNVWGKPGLDVTCGDCGKNFQQQG